MFSSTLLITNFMNFSACAVRVIGECDLMQEFLAASDTDQVNFRKPTIQNIVIFKQNKICITKHCCL